jgi:hypothetical protein
MTAGGIRRGAARVLAVVIAGMAGLGGLALVPQKAQAQPETAPRFMLLMDVSGSMAEPDTNGTIKIEGAKLAAMNALDGMARTSLVGLRAYPHGEACGPGRKVYDFAAPGDAGLRRAVTDLPTGGDTPTGPALLAAAEDLTLAGLTDGSTIILVSDGLSNCGDDPCEVAKRIAAEGLAIVNTVGFQISPAGQAQLNCIAEATGGQSFEARDADGLREAVEDAATPRLGVTLTSPEPDASVPVGSLVLVTATVTNTSKQRVDEVRALLRFPSGEVVLGNFDPGVPAPLRSLGNLAPGESRELRWQYRVAADAANRTSRFSVVSVARNAAPAQASGTVTYVGGLGLAHAGPLLRDRTRPVILGDSFSSGEGGGDYQPATDIDQNKCHRSPNTYTMTLDWATKPTVLACSGATTMDLTGAHTQWGEPSQVYRLLRLPERPDLALMTIGGNDVGFGAVIEHCIRSDGCQDTPTVNPALSGTCLLRYQLLQERINELPGCAPYKIPYREFALAKVANLGPTLEEVYLGVNTALNGPGLRANPAPLIILAYPKLMPFYTENRGSCSGIFFNLLKLTDEELRFGEEFTDRLNATIARSVARVRARGVPIYFASDVADAFRPNHTLCDTDPHAHRLTAYSQTQDSNWKVKQERLHPTRAGYVDMTSALLRWSHRPEAKGEVISFYVPHLSLENRPPDILDGGPVPLAEDPRTIAATAAAGLGIQVTASGFSPETDVLLTVQSAPRFAGVGHVGADGTMSAVAVLPRDLPPGPHTIVGEGFGPTGERRLVYAFIEVERPFPWGPLVLGVLAAAMVVGGVVALRRRQPSAGTSTVDGAATLSDAVG